MTITKATVLINTKDRLSIEWIAEEGFGVLDMTYQNDGTYKLDAEFTSIETVVKIFKALELETLKQL